MDGLGSYVPGADRSLSSLERLYGKVGLAAICASHVAVVGIGGVGSWVAEALVRSGVGRLTLIDMDHVSESNLNRQVHALPTTFGTSKVDAMAERLTDIRPSCSLRRVDDFVTAENWPQVMGSDVDLVVDACDDFKAKLAMAVWALAHRNRVVCVGAAGGKRMPERVKVGDLADATHDPVLSKLRYSLRKLHSAGRNGRMGLSVISSDEPVAMPGTGQAGQESRTMRGGGAALGCSGYGSSVAVTATFGMCASAWALNRLVESAN